MLISSYEELRNYIPNEMMPAMGDRNLFQKITPALASSEVWVENNVGGLEYVRHDPKLYSLLAGIVAADAIRSSLAMLDLVLTPNGLGIVSTDTIAPASQQRSEAAMRSLLNRRDRDILLAVTHLRSRYPDWANSSGASLWRSALFTIQFAYEPDKEEPSLAYLRSVMAQYHDAEEIIAQNWISPELMNRLRIDNLRGAEGSKQVIMLLRIAAGRMINSIPCEKVLMGVIDIIRKHPEDYPEWHASEVSKRFSLPEFENKKSDTGFWL